MNPVFSHLNDRRGVKLSAKSLKKILNVKHSTIIYYANKDSRIRRVNSIEVGSGKIKSSVFTID